MAEQPMSPDEMVKFEEQVLHEREEEVTVRASESEQVPAQPHDPMPPLANPRVRRNTRLPLQYDEVSGYELIGGDLASVALPATTSRMMAASAKFCRC